MYIIFLVTRPRFLTGLNKLNKNHVRRVSASLPDFNYPRVSAGAAGVFRSDVLYQFFRGCFIYEFRDFLNIRLRAFFPFRVSNQPLNGAPYFFRARFGGLNFSARNQRYSQASDKSPSLVSFSSEFSSDTRH